MLVILFTVLIVFALIDGDVADRCAGAFVGLIVGMILLFMVSISLPERWEVSRRQELLGYEPDHPAFSSWHYVKNQNNGYQIEHVVFNNLTYLPSPDNKFRAVYEQSHFKYGWFWLISLPNKAEERVEKLEVPVGEINKLMGLPSDVKIGG